MVPNAWFYKLKDLGRSRNHSNIPSNIAKEKQRPTSAAATTAQPSKPKHPHHQTLPRKSYYFRRELIPTCHDQAFHSSPTNTKSTGFSHDPPRKSSKQRVRRRTSRSSPKRVSSSVSADCSCRTTLWSKTDSPTDYSASPSDGSLDPELSDSFPSEFRCDHVLAVDSLDNKVSLSSSGRCKVGFDSNDIVITVDKESLVSKLDKLHEFDNVPDLDLPPIITKTVKFDDEVEDIKRQLQSKEPAKYRRSSAKYNETKPQEALSVKIIKDAGVTVKDQKTGSVRRHSVTSPGVRLRVNSPRIASRRIQSHGRRSISSVSSSCSRGSLSESLAIVKSSFNPQRDFRESMLEMIVENNIKASRDLEDLLACYLSLNSDEYHELIIKVFKRIWFDLIDTQ